MTRQLVLLHGRAQQNKDAQALKAEWLDALEEGLAKNGLTLPIAESDVRFPFYGDTLDQMAAGAPASVAAKVIVRGQASHPEREFMISVLSEVAVQAGLSDAQLIATAGPEVIERGPLNWAWAQSVLRAIDRYVPYGSGSSIALVTNDVYQYLTNSIIREEVETGVAAAFRPEKEAVVVAHSLGSVVAYNVLRNQGHLRKWKVPALITVGSPLAVTEIKKTLRRIAPLRQPECVGSWYNAMDRRDVVALYPLDDTNFPIAPSPPVITNNTEVQNRTGNRHGISGYIDDSNVAKRIYDALVD